MTYQTWPAELPRPLREGLSTETPDQRRVKATEIGPPETRDRRTLVPRRIAMQFVLSRAEFAILEAFYDDTIGRGASYFWMPDPITDGWPVLDEAFHQVWDQDGMLVLVSALELCSWRGGRPSVRGLRGMKFIVPVAVDIMP